MEGQARAGLGEGSQEAKVATHQGQPIPMETLEPELRPKRAGFRRGGQDRSSGVNQGKEGPSLSQHPRGPPTQSRTEGYSGALTVAM